MLCLCRWIVLVAVVVVNANAPLGISSPPPCLVPRIVPAPNKEEKEDETQNSAAVTVPAIRFLLLRFLFFFGWIFCTTGE